MDTTIASEAAPDQEASLWEDFIDVFYAPAQVFARRREGRFVLALLGLTIVMTLLFYASQSVLAEATQAEFARAMEGQEVTAEQMETMRRMSGIFGTLGFLISFPIGVLLTGALLWIVGKAVGSVATFAAAAMVATYAQVPRVLQQLLAVVQGMVMDPVTSLHHVGFSPARFLDPDTTSMLIMGLLSRFDLFTVWVTVLLAIGLAVVGGIPRSRAAVAAGVVWLLGAVPIVIGAL